MLVTSDEGSPEELFEGYAYIDSDLIFGALGAKDYSDATGKQVKGGHDGCYITCARNSHGYEFETDYAGYKKIFYYWSSQLWAVSDSFTVLIDYLRDSGVRIRPRYAFLATAGVRGSAMEQSLSHYTAAENVRIVPLHRKLRISQRSAELVGESYSDQEPPLQPDVGYSDLLKRHLTMWLDRFSHWITEPTLRLSLELTGGLDSRVNFAMYLFARERAKSSHEARVPRFNCGPSIDGRDLEVAEILTNSYGLPLNETSTRVGGKLSARQRFDRWREVSLGTYHPVYFPTEAPDPREIRVGGSAAGNHRPFYQRKLVSRNENTFIESCLKRVHHEHLKGEIHADMAEFFAGLSNQMSPSDRLIEHYRYFRNRMHSGRTPQYRVLFTPFSSRTLDRAFAMMGSENVPAGQINYDIMASLAPELLEVEFDEPSKSPNDRVWEQLTTVTIDDTPVGGQVWGTPAHPAALTSSDVGSPLQYLRAAYDEAVGDPFVSSFWPGETKQLAEEAWNFVDENGKFSHASQAIPISAFLLSHEVSPFR